MTTSDENASRIQQFKGAVNGLESAYTELHALLQEILNNPASVGSPRQARVFGKQLERMGSAIEQVGDAYGDFVDGEPDEDEG